MADREKVLLGMKMCTRLDGLCALERCPYFDEEDCVSALLRDALELLKAQEQEISRLKHHMDCDAAEKLPSGCVGYGRGFNDDEPCETCKACEKYNGYGEE